MSLMSKTLLLPRLSAVARQPAHRYAGWAGWLVASLPTVTEQFWDIDMNDISSRRYSTSAAKARDIWFAWPMSKQHAIAGTRW
jgi:hypothetical protein